MVVLALAACTEARRDIEETSVVVSLPALSPELLAIDSLSWQRPDSALAVLLPCFDTCCAYEPDRHYANLLLAELLYKNDYAQTIRDAVLEATAYFDSLMPQLPSLKGNARKAVDSNYTYDLAFLVARAHYINGVGFYEQDSVILACEEYLAALETMERQLDDKELVGKKARFMTYTYNRLGELFTDWMLAEPAIACYRQALSYCRREPTSAYGIPVLFYNLGIQYDVANQRDSAAFYYDEALTSLPDLDNVHYRDIVTTKSVLAYNMGCCTDTVIREIRRVISLSPDEDEKVTRFLTLGNILYEDKQYDSSIFYLETVFKQQEDVPSKILAAENLCSIYRLKGDSLKAQGYASFLAGFAVSEIERRTEISKANELFKGYLARRQERRSEEERAKAVKRVIRIVVPLAVAITLAVVCSLALRHKRLLKKHREAADKALEAAEQEHENELRLWKHEADKAFEEKEMRYEKELARLRDEMEKRLEEAEKKHLQWVAKTQERNKMELDRQRGLSEKEIEETKKRQEREFESERLAYQKERETLRQSLQQSEARINALESALRLRRTEAELRREAFLKEPVCGKISDSVKGIYITAREGSKQNVVLSDDEIVALKEAVLRHYPNIQTVLLAKNPRLGRDDLLLCHLYLLGMDERQIGALMCKTYSAIKKRVVVLKRFFALDGRLSDYILHLSTFEGDIADEKTAPSGRLAK